MSEETILILVIVTALVVVFAIWRFNKLRLRGRYFDVEGELVGENQRKAKKAKPDIPASEQNVTSTIGGKVQNSTVYTAGENIGVSPKNEKGEQPVPRKTDVHSGIKGDVTDSDIKVAGGNISDKK